ncbi:hypothetical protein AB0D10_26245 [Kitasatospora sp. NPDC048545]|uniref:hypothetical protein n=1 Tax=Kitasatospora sp. NPDC048545 TaxID=3157208 RepID=UPI0033C1DF58
MAPDPQTLQDLKAIHELLDGTDARNRPDRWADALAADVTWSKVRTLAQRILTARPDHPHPPLPRRVSPQHAYDRARPSKPH